MQGQISRHNNAIGKKNADVFLICDIGKKRNWAQFLISLFSNESHTFWTPCIYVVSQIN